MEQQGSRVSGKETTVVRCPGLPYPDYAELDKLQAEGWRTIKTRVDIDDHCVYFTLEKDADKLVSILQEIGRVLNGN